MAPLLFLILMGDINCGISSSSIVSFADDTRLYNGISNVDDGSLLHNDLNSVYDWASCNNMCFNGQKFKYICFSPHSSSPSNTYTSSSFDIINYRLSLVYNLHPLLQLKSGEKVDIYVSVYNPHPYSTATGAIHAWPNTNVTSHKWTFTHYFMSYFLYIRVYIFVLQISTMNIYGFSQSYFNFLHT